MQHVNATLCHATRRVMRLEGIAAGSVSAAATRWRPPRRAHLGAGPHPSSPISASARSSQGRISISWNIVDRGGERLARKLGPARGAVEPSEAELTPGEQGPETGLAREAVCALVEARGQLDTGRVRSPSSAFLDVRILSASYLGVQDSGESKRARWVERGAPKGRQDVLSAPDAEQAISRRAPRSS